MRVLFFGTYDETTHPRVRVLREGLASHGVDVAVCNVPLRVTTAERLRVTEQPWRVPVLAWRILVAWIRLVWRSTRLDAPDMVIVGYLGQFDVHLARWLFRRTPVVLDFMVGLGATARDRRARAGGRVDRLLTTIDRAALRTPDLVLVDTDEQAEALPLVPRRFSVVEIGAAQAWFEAPSSGEADDPSSTRVVFFGLYTPLQGAPVIGRAISRLAGDDRLSFTMVGTGQDRTATAHAARRNDQVEWLDWVDADALPRLVADHDVCLGIFGTGDKARRVVPNKIYQGAAAGCVVVTSDTPCQRRALGDAARYVPAGDDAALANVLLELAELHDLRRGLRHESVQYAATNFCPTAITRPLFDELADLGR